jgi:hypothetical protein
MSYLLMYVLYIYVYIKAKETEINIIKNILQNNEYNTNLIKNPSPPRKKTKHTH